MTHSNRLSPRLPEVLDDLESRPIDTLQELIDFNREHADVELPPGMFWPLLIYVDTDEVVKIIPIKQSSKLPWL